LWRWGRRCGGPIPCLRQGLALHIPAPAIVAFEQALPTVILAPLVWRGMHRALAAFDWRDWLALAVLGCGSSALATLLFTVAFTYGRPNTPVLLQQLQPLFCCCGSASPSRRTPSASLWLISAGRARRFVPNCLRPPALAGRGRRVGTPRSWQCRLRFCGGSVPCSAATSARSSPSPN